MDEHEVIRSPLRAIKANCLECCCGQQNEVKLCTCSTCPLYPFRLGRNPFVKKRVMTEEQRAAAAERLRKAREDQKTQQQ